LFYNKYNLNAIRQCYIMSKIPWVEFYRPSNLDNIVLEEQNKEILNNILLTGHFPNLLFYGPPGTGKTTTVINLIEAYQHKYNSPPAKELITHLNASDERGIDIIRNQISLFVKSKPLFNKGLKFVILDEVDYMTKNAQQALKYLLQNNNNNNVRFCLICNYISKIYEGLQNEFINLRFNQLPQQNVIDFLKHILELEKICIDECYLISIQQMFGSDLRSMINFLQSNISIDNTNLKIINDVVLEEIIIHIKSDKPSDELTAFIYNTCEMYNIDFKNIIKTLINYIIRRKSLQNTSEFLSFVETLIHSQILNANVYINYALVNLKKFI
jgi:DNA polymerase III delta prime subunit